MRHKEVHRIPRLAAVRLEQVGGTGKARCQFSREHGGNAELILAGSEAVAEVTVPLGPSAGETAELVTAVADGPRFGDEIDARSPYRGPAGQLFHRAVEHVVGIEFVEMKAALGKRVAEHRRQIEPESICAKDIGPV